VLAVVLSLPTVAFASSSKGEGNDRERAPITRVIKKIQKFFGVTPNDDGLQVPVPAPPPRP
jgi:hypothetical protein